MPHPRTDHRHELPEYPVRGGASRHRPGRTATVWDRYPLGSRIGAVVLSALVLGGAISLVKSDADDGAAATTGLVVDDSVASADGGLGPDDVAVPETQPAEDGAVAAAVAAAAPAAIAVQPAVATTPPFTEGTLPLIEGTLPPTVATTPKPTVAPVRNAAPAATKPAVVKPAATTAARARMATTAKPVVKAAPSTTKPTQPRQAIVKPPTTAPTPRTTRAPVTTAPAPVPKTNYTADEVVALIRAMWPADSVDKALDVAHRESRYRHTAYNGWCCYGVFQINASAHMRRLQARGLGVDALYDPRVNIEIALEIFQASGWGPWGG